MVKKIICTNLIIFFKAESVKAHACSLWVEGSNLAAVELLSIPELKAQMNFSDLLLSVVGLYI